MPCAVLLRSLRRLRCCRVTGSASALFAASLLAALPHAAPAEDLVLLANGQRIAGRIDAGVPTDPSQVAINTGNGIILFDRSQVRGEDLGFATRLQRLASDDLAGTVHLARWARSKGMNKEALALLTRALALPGVDLSTRALHVRLVDEIQGPESALPWYAAYVQAGGSDPATLARYEQLRTIKERYDAAHGITTSATVSAPTPEAPIATGEAGSSSSAGVATVAPPDAKAPIAGLEAPAVPAPPATAIVPARTTPPPSPASAAGPAASAAPAALAVLTDRPPPAAPGGSGGSPPPISAAAAAPAVTPAPVAVPIPLPTMTLGAAPAPTPRASVMEAAAVRLPPPRPDAWELRSWDIIGAPESNPVELQQATIPPGPDGPDQTLHPLAISYQGGELHKAVIARTIRFNLLAQPALGLWVKNPNGHAVAVAMAVKTGRQWTYFESAPQIVRPGEHFQYLRFDFSRPMFKCAASDWQPTATVADADQAQEFQFLVLNEHDNGQLLIYDMGMVAKDDL